MASDTITAQCEAGPVTAGSRPEGRLEHRPWMVDDVTGSRGDHLSVHLHPWVEAQVRRRNGRSFSPLGSRESGSRRRSRRSRARAWPVAKDGPPGRRPSPGQRCAGRTPPLHGRFPFVRRRWRGRRSFSSCSLRPAGTRLASMQPRRQADADQRRRNRRLGWLILWATRCDTPRVRLNPRRMCQDAAMDVPLTLEARTALLDRMARGRFRNAGNVVRTAPRPPGTSRCGGGASLEHRCGR